MLAVAGSLIVAWTNFTNSELAGRPLAVKIIATLLIVCFVLFCGMLGGLFVLFAGLVKANRGLLCEHVIELSEDGLIERTETNESLHRWGAIQKAFVTSNYIYVYVTDHSYHQIPLRAFTSTEHLEGFKSELSRRTSIRI